MTPNKHILCLTNWDAILQVLKLTAHSLVVCDPFENDAGMCIGKEECKFIMHFENESQMNTFLEPYQEYEITPDDWRDY